MTIDITCEMSELAENIRALIDVTTSAAAKARGDLESLRALYETPSKGEASALKRAAGTLAEAQETLERAKRDMNWLPWGDGDDPVDSEALAAYLDKLN
jgi:hypothetical protein